MHCFRLLPIAAIVIVGMSCPPSFATGNVLVPSDDDTPAAQPAESDQTLPAAGSSSQSAIPDSVAPAHPAMTPDPNLQVVNMPTPTPQSTAAQAGLPRSLKISIDSKYRWSAQDALTVQKVLGIEPAAMAKHCRLSASGMARSDSGRQGIYSFDLGLMPSALLQYDGSLTDISLRLHALCDKVPLPSTARYVMQVDDKYAVLLPSVPCETPPKNSAQLSIQYNGNGNGKCVYQ